MTAAAYSRRSVTSPAPVARPAARMREGHNIEVVASIKHHDRIGKAAEQKTTDSNLRAHSRDGCGGVGLTGKLFESARNRDQELPTKCWTLSLVPANGLGQLLLRLWADPDWRRHRSRISRSRRRRTSTQSSPAVCSASRLATRRSISAAHAASRSRSAGPSRLARSSVASSARWLAGSCRASVSSLSAFEPITGDLPSPTPHAKHGAKVV